MIVNELKDWKRSFGTSVTVEAADLTGGADALAIVIDPALTGMTYSLSSILIMTSANALKNLSGITAAYSTATGTLTLTDTLTEFATGDKIELTGVLK